MMNDDILLDRGYKQYDPTKIDNELVVLRFQKRFDDSFGKKYFINVVKSSMDFIPESQRGDWWTPFKYTYEVQVTFDENEKALNLEFFSDWPIDKVEEFMENFFNTMGPNYYESWDTERRHTRPEE